MKDFLPFTRPSIDEATIAGVAEVLRSGWITSGPQVKAFEAALSQHCGGRPVRAFSSGTARWRSPCASPASARATRSSPRRFPGSPPPTWCWRSARARCSSTSSRDAQHRSRPGRGAITQRQRRIIPVDLAGLPVDRDRLYALARRSTTCASSRTRRRPSARAGRASRSARSATSSPSASTPTRTSPPPRAARSCCPSESDSRSPAKSCGCRA